MTQRRPLITALAAAIGGLLLFVALLTGHCPRPILAPHAAPAAVVVSAPAVIRPAGAAAVPADHSCVTETPPAVATSATIPVDAPHLLAGDPGRAEPAAGVVASTSAISRAPPLLPAPSPFDLCVLRV